MVHLAHSYTHHINYGLQATYWHESGFWAERSTWVWGDASQTLNPFLFLPSRPQDQSDTGTSSTLQFSADPQPIQLDFIPFFNNSACLKLHKSFPFTTITPRKSFLTEIWSLCTSPIDALKEKTILLNLDEQSPKDEKYESLPQDKPHLIAKWSIWEISPRSRGTTRQITYGFYSLGTTDIWPNKQTNMASVLLRGSASQLAAQSLPGNPALRLAARFSPFLLLAHYHLIRSAWLEARGWNVKSILN